MAKKNLRQCRSDSDLRRYCKKQGAEIHEGKKHTRVVTELGQSGWPRHPGDIGRGLLYAIFKQLGKIGIQVFFLLGFVGLLKLILI